MQLFWFYYILVRKTSTFYQITAWLYIFDIHIITPIRVFDRLNCHYKEGYVWVTRCERTFKIKNHYLRYLSIIFSQFLSPKLVFLLKIISDPRKWSPRLAVQYTTKNCIYCIYLKGSAWYKVVSNLLVIYIDSFGWLFYFFFLIMKKNNLWPIIYKWHSETLHFCNWMNHVCVFYKQCISVFLVWLKINS